MDDDKLFNSILPHALKAIEYIETQNGNNLYYKFKTKFPQLQKFAKKFIGDKSAPSIGISNIKFEDDLKNPILKKIYNDLGIYSSEQLSDPKIADIATKARLKYLWDYELDSNQYDAFGQPIKSVEGMTYAWNRGSDKLNSGNAKIADSDYVQEANKLYRNWGDQPPQFAHYNFNTIVTPQGIVFDVANKDRKKYKKLLGDIILDEI